MWYVHPMLCLFSAHGTWGFMGRNAMVQGGPPMKHEDLLPYDHQEIGKPTPWWKTLGFVYYMIRALPGLMFGANQEGKVNERMRGFVRMLKEERGNERIGAVG
jgi:hypothetical protein